MHRSLPEIATLLEAEMIQFFAVTNIDEWNNLPESIIGVQSINSFKNNFQQSMDRRQQTDLLFSKAFDTIPHRRLLNKLEHPRASF